MSEYQTVNTVANANNWRIAHTMQDNELGRFFQTFVHREFGVLHIGLSNEDMHVCHSSWYCPRSPEGETMAAGDRLRYVLAALQGERAT